MSEAPNNERILAALRDARQKLEAVERARSERIAIIGMAGRFPGAQDIGQFWDMLAEGRAGIREVSDEELRAAGVPPEVSGLGDYVRAWASFEAPDAFDAAFFGYSPREAEVLDPQHRVFLECAWHALEDAGIDSSREARPIGVYAGAALNSYVINLHSDPQVRDSLNAVQAVVSNVLGLMPTRVSYHLNLTGPSVGVQTGCSSSLVAVHTACRALLSGECDMALAGGATVSGVQPQGYLYQEGSIASPDGACHAFDARGQGTVFGNGVGVVVLKRLSDALADGDDIRAVIRGSAINNDGADKVGLIAPSVSGQAAVIRSALDASGIDPATLGYVEAHGTGTDLGDPIEVAALHRVLKPAFAGRDNKVALGSVKTNIGHLDAAAGIAGLIKTVLALQHAELPPSLGYETPNPNIDFAAGPLRVNVARTAWPAGETPRRAGVSSFGMGGTNAHLVLEEALPPATADAAPRRWQVLPLSARTPGALDAATIALAQHLHAQAGADLSAVARTLQVGRRQMAQRRVVVCADAHGAVEALGGSDGEHRVSGEAQPGARAVAFLFPGQGSQRSGMARALYDDEPVFRAALDDCAAALDGRLPLLDLLFPALAGSAAEARMRQTAHAQPALFAVEYALARLWMSWGVQPQALLGHSVGEYVAACLAGVFTLPDAVRLVARRGELMQRCEPGAMLAVMLDEPALRAVLPADVDLAVINGPRQCVVAGSFEAVERFQSHCDVNDIVARPLATSHAFHSAMMDAALGDFAEAVCAVPLAPPQIDIVSNVSGDWLTAQQATDPLYWVRQLRDTVRFAAGLDTLAQRDDLVWLEVGPGEVLSNLLRQQRAGAAAVASLPGGDASADVAAALARLWVAGVDIDWSAYAADRPQCRAPLPGYPFERERYWITLDDTRAAARPPAIAADADAKLADMADWFHLPSWQAGSPDAPAPAVQGRWLVIADDATRTALAPLLDDVDVVWADAQAVATADACRALLQTTADGGALSQIADLRPLGAADDVAAGFDALLALLQALPPAAPDDALCLSIVSRGAWRLSAAEGIRPAAATLTGLLQVAGQEVPSLRPRQIDIEAHSPAVMQDLADELRRPWVADARLVALRDGTRWLRDYRPLRLPVPTRSVLHEDGAYLIAGDLLEGVGMVLARGIFRACRARLVLVGSSGLPLPDAWEAWLATHGPRHPASVLIRTLQGLRQEGAEFVLLSGPLHDRVWLDDALAGAVAHYGLLRGVFHVDAMGDNAGCTLAQTGDAERARALDAKIGQLAALAASPHIAGADFVVLQSSLSTVAGGAGFGAYAASNSWLDAFAASREGNTPWIAIAWDAVQRDVLAAAQGSTPSALMAAAISVDEAWQAVERILSRPRFSQVVLTPRPLAPRLARAFDPALAVTAAAPAAGAHGRPAIATPYVEPRTETERMVALAMGELLGIAQVGADDDFFELGGHSLLAIQAVTRLRREFGVELPMRALLFEARTVAGIAEVIDRGRAALAAAAVTSTGDAEVDALLGEIEAMNADEVARQS